MGIFKLARDEMNAVGISCGSQWKIWREELSCS